MGVSGWQTSLKARLSDFCKNGNAVLLWNDKGLKKGLTHTNDNDDKKTGFQNCNEHTLNPEVIITQES